MMLEAFLNNQLICGLPLYMRAVYDMVYSQQGEYLVANGGGKMRSQFAPVITN